jgi:hypothetical protein
LILWYEPREDNLRDLLASRTVAQSATGIDTEEDAMSNAPPDESTIAALDNVRRFTS